jgi:hypothetical protein
MINNVERVQRSLAICMWVGRVSIILRELREDPESLDLVDLGPRSGILACGIRYVKD